MDASNTDSAPLPPTDAAASAPSPQPGPAALATTRAALRLAIGLALIGADEFAARLAAWEAAHPAWQVGPEGANDAQAAAGGMASALLGLLFEATDTTIRAASATTDAAGRVADALILPVARPLLRPFAAPFRALAARGRAEERRSRRMAADLTGLLIEDLTDVAGENPGVRRLVDAQVDRLLPDLAADPAIQQLLVQQLGVWLAGLAARSASLDPLVQALGDRYIAYLNENPDDVQNLIQGQALSMADEVTDSVRGLTVTGDTFLEIIARRVFRRPPRDDAPPVDLRRRRARFRADGERGEDRI